MEETKEFMAHETEAISSFVTWLRSFITWDNLVKLIFSVVVILVLCIIYKLVIRAIKKVPAEKVSKHKTMLLTTMVKYIFYVIVVMFVLSRFGVKLSAIWGAAGIAGVAIGFAAQTSVSNIISGIFVLTEGTIKIGDFISVGDVSGVVDNVNLLSVRVHTLDNQMVRIPNSTVINSNLTNFSFHSKRRFTFSVSIAYEMDMEKALEALNKAPTLCPTVLQDPAPAAWFDGFGDSGICMTAAVWFNSSDLVATKNAMYIAIKKCFDEAGIEIPYNKIVVDSGNLTVENAKPAAKTAKAPAAKAEKAPAKSKAKKA
ncbi:MAG: mechanosensitive ion channel family protein [Treponema sp.]|nr:mechanosensitive ion channel family protein [Treponema sp.]